jgi:cyclopropane fatty-acyl-phospholipid synthase-like methyltransferase
MRVCGMTDFTDGKYVDDRDDWAAYVAAQERQAEYLLDQAHCRPGSRLLDIGCGYGRILEQAARRGANSVGITISTPQVSHCRARGLDVRQLNYRDIDHCAGSNWEQAFHAIIANGSLEHFVQPSDAAAGRADAIYEELFTICRRLLVEGGRFVTTAIHFRSAAQFDPAQIARGPAAQPPGSDDYQFAMIARWFGGWYPAPGQLQRCAAGRFELVEQEDGTSDYHRTSEFWMCHCKRRFAFDPRVWGAVARQFWRRPRPALEMLRLQLRDESWAWQFRPPAPMQLWRQTWIAR